MERTRVARLAPAVLAGVLAVALTTPTPVGDATEDVATSTPAAAAPAAPASDADPIAAARVLVVADEVPPPPPPPPPPEPPEPSASRAAFEVRFPAQVAAAEGHREADRRWALLIGINAHQGSVADNIGSRQDAELLRELLLAAGWRDDHIVLLTDGDATGAMIREGLAWLASSTTDRSVAVFHYSGHSLKRYGPGGRIDDIAVWPTDDAFVFRDEFATALADVAASQMWLNIATCNAAALDVDGVTGPGRLVTFSSAAPEKSYEDPLVGHSVWGYYLLDEALNGTVHRSVQTAFAMAAPQATALTDGQVPYGAQRPVLRDELGDSFVLRVPTRATTLRRR